MQRCGILIDNAEHDVDKDVSMTRLLPEHTDVVDNSRRTLGNLKFRFYKLYF